jgi:hypothetical protein
MKIDPKLFNTDPKFEAERGMFDELLDGAIARRKAKIKASKPPKNADLNFFDELFGGKDEEENENEE